MRIAPGDFFREFFGLARVGAPERAVASQILPNIETLLIPISSLAPIISAVRSSGLGLREFRLCRSEIIIRKR